MRYLELKTLETRKGRKIDYREHCLSILEAPADPNSGMTVREMRKAIKVIDRIEPAKPGEVVALEDAEWEYLNQRVSGTTFQFADASIIQFVEDIEHCPVYDPRPKESEVGEVLADLEPGA